MSKQSRPCKKLEKKPKPKSQKSSYSAKFSLTSYSPSSLFWAFRSIWGFWKWSQMIPHTQKPGVYKKKQVSSMFRSGVTPWRAPPPPQTIDDDIRHLKDVFVLLHHVFWVGLCLNNPDHAKNWRKYQNQSLRSWFTPRSSPWPPTCLLYTSDAADE